DVEPPGHATIARVASRTLWSQGRSLHPVCELSQAHRAGLRLRAVALFLPTASVEDDLYRVALDHWPACNDDADSLAAGEPDRAGRGLLSQQAGCHGAGGHRDHSLPDSVLYHGA